MTPKPPRSGRSGPPSARSGPGSKSGAESGRKSGFKAGPKSGPKSGFKAGFKAGYRSGPTSDAESDPTSGSKFGAKAGGKPGFKARPKPGHTGPNSGPNSGPTSGPTSGAKFGPKTGPKSDVRPGAPAGAKTGARSGPRTNFKAGPKPAPRTTPVETVPDRPAVPERIAKVLARAGIASRRDAEKMIEDGRVTVNGVKVERAALNVLPSDAITVDDKPVGEPEVARLWLYYKPTGLVTTTRDEQGRETIFDRLPEDLPRVVTVGRLDLNSEGLLLLTNDGGIKRRLELPSTGWLRRYRVRINGRPTEDTFAPLRAGITVDGQSFQPMQVAIDRQQGANAWLTVGLREGKNREIRRAMTDIGLTVNRLIRISYGPFQLGQLKEGEVQEIRGKVLRDQLGLEGPKPEAPAPTRRRKPSSPRQN